MAEDGLLHTTELIKAALPYVDVRTKLTLDLLVKLYELIICIRNYRTKDIAACGFASKQEKMDMETLLNKIRPSCNQKERAFVDKILNIFQAKRIFEMYNTYMEVMKTMEGFEGFSGKDDENSSEYNFMNSFSGFDFSSIFGSGNKEDKEDKEDIEDNKYSEGQENTDDLKYNEYDSPAAEINDIDTATASNSTGNDNNSIFESLKSLIPPDQMETFENLRMLFGSMSYDDNEKQGEDME